MLTKRQKQILDFINLFSKKRGYSPSLEEIRRHFKLSALSGIHQHIEALKNKGFLEKQKNRKRSIEVSGAERLVQIPLLGTIAAGQPIEVIENKETIAIPQNKLPKTGEVYALKVNGDSMVEENIHDGDTILIKRQGTAENGQKVVALLNGDEATLKTFYKEKGQIRLQPANKNYQPIIVRRGQGISLQGVLLDVIKEIAIGQYTDPHVLPSQKEEKQTINISEKAVPYFRAKNFTLFHGDCLNILPQIPPQSVDMVFADPPYNLSNDGFSVHAGKRVSVNKGPWDRSKGFKDDYDFHYRWIDACKRILKPNGTLWVSGTYHSIYQCGHALQSLGYHILNDISWFKPNGSPNLSCRYFTASHETLIWARKEKKAKHFFNYNLMRNEDWPEDFIKRPAVQMRSVWAIYPPKKQEKKFGKHPTQKPMELLKRVVLASTKPDAVILDPFTGSSTTGIAAHMLGRKFIGIDIEKEYLELSISRFKESG